jgi:dephospho-CoA kinase
MPAAAGGIYSEKIMLKIGLTGGIGSGKTVVANIFRQLGVPVYEADAEARMLTESNAEIKSEIKKHFGSEVFLKDGSLDRSKMASLVFSDNEKLLQLNAIVHPFVKKHFTDWLQQHHTSNYIIKEAAILFESGSDKGLDKVIAVTAPEDIRIQRVIERDNISQERVKGVIKNQMSEEERTKRSDYIIINNDQVLIIPQVLKLHRLFQNGTA